MPEPELSTPDTCPTPHCVAGPHPVHVDHVDTDGELFTEAALAPPAPSTDEDADAAWERMQDEGVFPSWI